jgi:6,7-dimethyl-8-ribityllumazine synthase
MSSEHQNLSSKKMVNVKDIGHFHFTVIVSQWNDEITGALEKGCIDTLYANGLAQEHLTLLHVPGAWELISASKLALDHLKTDAVICIGAVIKGDTPHFEYICQAVSVGLAQLNTISNTPIIFGVLTTLNQLQAEERAGGIHGNKGDEAAYTALKMAELAQLMK